MGGVGATHASASTDAETHAIARRTSRIIVMVA
jgi:hypothetical protein